MSTQKRVCVIGAGTAGLSAIKNSVEYGFQVTCYEQLKQLGGTWVYDESVEAAKYDDEVHSSMYEGLHTNLPKEVMGYHDFEYSKDIQKSFVSSDTVLHFLQSYAEHFHLQPYIKFSHTVIRVRPQKNHWEVIVCDLTTQEYQTEIFDFIFVCNGHYTNPVYPNIPGMDIYKGRQLHSHLFRKNDEFKDEKVLIIGAGPSGMDIADHIRPFAKHVYLSHHLNPAPYTAFMGNCTQKTDLQEFTSTGAIFKDGSEEQFSVVIYCTGYKYSFPFLSVDTCIHVEENGVYPLYKHVINIEYPTMALIGLPYLTLPTQCFDLQVRFTLKYFSGQKLLPSKKDMKADLQNEIEERLAAGIPKRHFHSMGSRQYDYYAELSNLAGLPNIKPVIQNIMKDTRKRYIYELDSYRMRRYNIIDEENFVRYDTYNINK